MKNKIKRTYETGLSDDELIIFDVLFDSSDEINSLIGGEDFSLGFNYQTHSLSVSELKDTINKFLNNGLMHLKLVVLGKIKRILSYVRLTDKGGKLWEMERHPNWDKFVADSSSEINGQWMLSVYSPTYESACKFIETSHKSRLYELRDPDNLEVSEIHGKECEYLIPWKVFDKLYVIKSLLSERNGNENRPEIDIELYESELLWWRDVEELQILQLKIGI